VTQPTSRLALAKQGNPEAIAGIIRDSLRPSFNVTGERSIDDFLEISLETDKQLEQGYIDDLIKKIEDYVLKYFGISKARLRVFVHSEQDISKDRPRNPIPSNFLNEVFDIDTFGSTLDASPDISLEDTFGDTLKNESSSDFDLNFDNPLDNPLNNPPSNPSVLAVDSTGVSSSNTIENKISSTNVSDSTLVTVSHTHESNLAVEREKVIQPPKRNSSSSSLSKDVLTNPLSKPTRLPPQELKASNMNVRDNGMSSRSTKTSGGNGMFGLKAINFLATLAFLGFIVALFLNLIPEFPSLAFKNLGNAQIGELVSSLFFTILIVERSLEVFISTWRGVEASQIKQSIADQQLAVDHASNSASDNSSADSDREIGDLNDLNADLTTYKATTAKIALWLGLTLGILTSFVGIRILETFIQVGVDANLNAIQLRTFRILDIVLTGGLIAGGSKGFHQLMSIYEEFMDATTRRIKNNSDNA